MKKVIAIVAFPCLQPFVMFADEAKTEEGKDKPATEQKAEETK